MKFPYGEQIAISEFNFNEVSAIICETIFSIFIKKGEKKYPQTRRASRFFSPVKPYYFV